jgi:hypothetical protein
MARFEDTTPTPRILLGLKNQSWTVAGAVSELVDNSFGSGRGNAKNVWITWNKKNRVMEVLDDGVGMDSITRLFQLGNTIGRSVKDIGEYGSGGTMALLWLADKVNVWTLSDGKVASASRDWIDEIKKDQFSPVDADWYKATVSNTPTDLLKLRHGTLIRLTFPPKRHVTESNVRRELARTYGPALRHGKTISWRTVSRRATEDIVLTDPVARIARPKRLSVVIDVDGSIMSASGVAGIVKGQSITDSAITVSFGPRVIKITRECFASPDGESSYAGIGVVGYIELDDGWQPYLSLTKTAVDDDRLWSALMSALYEQLLPLLEKTQEDKEYLLLEDIALDLQQVLNKKIRATINVMRPASDGTGESPEHWPETGNGNGGPGDNPSEGSGSGGEEPQKEHGAVLIEIVKVEDDQIDGLMCRVDIEGNRVDCFVNKDHEDVQEALIARPPNRLALRFMIVAGIAQEISKRRALLVKAFPRSVIDKVDQLDDRLRPGFITRLLMDRVQPHNAADSA